MDYEKRVQEALKDIFERATKIAEYRKEYEYPVDKEIDKQNLNFKEFCKNQGS